MVDDYPYNGRLTRWDEIHDGLAIVACALNADPVSFAPGQYLTLGLMGPAGKLVQRPMSVSSPATNLTDYEFFIRYVPGGEFTPLLWQRHVGDPINLKGPKGRFLLQDDGRSCLLVASGTGLAPFMSMIETLIDEGATRDLHLLHGVSYDHDLAWRDRLTEIAASGALPLDYVASVSRPRECPDWHGLTGRVENVIAAEMDRRGLNAANATLYLCGNPDMIEAVQAIATERGFPPEQIRKELYWPKGRPHGKVAA